MRLTSCPNTASTDAPDRPSSAYLSVQHVLTHSIRKTFESAKRFWRVTVICVFALASKVKPSGVDISPVTNPEEAVPCSFTVSPSSVVTLYLS